MRLDRAHTTIGGWTAARAYPPFLLVVGASLALTDPDYLRLTPGFAFADNLIPIQLWGIGFLAVGAGLGVALLRHSRTWYLRLLPAAMLWISAWVLLFAGAAIFGDASPSGWAWPAVVVWHMWAVQLSLESNQVDADGQRRP